MKIINTTIATPIINQGDFALKYYSVYDIESVPEKAIKFITELYKWGLIQQEDIEKLLDTVYEKEMEIIFRTKITTLH